MKNVVFPDPFGPIIPVVSSLVSLKFTALTAMRPSKCLLNPSAVSMSDIQLPFSAANKDLKVKEGGKFLVRKHSPLFWLP